MNQPRLNLNSSTYKADLDAANVLIHELRQNLAAKDALFERLRIDFMWFKERSNKNRSNYRRALLSIYAINKELGK